MRWTVVRIVVYSTVNGESEKIENVNIKNCSSDVNSPLKIAVNNFADKFFKTCGF